MSEQSLFEKTLEATIRLAKVADYTDADDVDDYERSLIDLSQIALKQNLLKEAVMLANRAAIKCGGEDSVRNFKETCREVFGRGGFSDDRIATMVMDTLSNGPSEDPERWGWDALRDWEQYADALINSGKSNIVKKAAEMATGYVEDGPNAIMRDIAANTLKRIALLTPVQ